MLKRFQFIFVLIVAVWPAQRSFAADMTISNIFPANNASAVCADTRLRITFDTAPIVSTDPNKVLQICKVSDDTIVYELVLHLLPVDLYGYISTAWPYQITLDGKTINYVPCAVAGNTLEVYPSSRLEYNTEYYIMISAGFCSDSSGNTSRQIAGNAAWRFTTRAAPAPDRDYTIASDNTGDFCTVQGAVDAVNENDTSRTFIRLMNGNYRGCVHIPADKINITFLGQSRDSAIITGYNREPFNGGTNARALIMCYADGLQLYDITLQNTAPDNSGQAETIKYDGQKGIMDNCKFLSYQDTLLLNGQAYFNNCYVEGDTDFIWGTGTVYFNQCELKFMSITSYMTQPRTPQYANGFFFVDCVLTANTGARNSYFARLFDGYPYAQTAIINCTMPTNLILAKGWYQNTQGDLTNIRLWEYQSMSSTTGTLIYTGLRLAGSKQLTDEEAIYWRDVNNVYSYNPWNPKIASDAPCSAWLPIPVSGATDISTGVLTWSPGAGAASHMIYFGTANPPPYAAEVSENSYTIDQSVYANTTYYWRVDEKNSAGTTTGQVWSFVTSASLDTTPPNPDPLTWSVEPNAMGISSITMTATAATDESGVEYGFVNVTDANHNSGWQDSPTYTDINLDNNTNYIYKVRARDKSMSRNSTAFSDESSAQTDRFECIADILSDYTGDCQTNFDDFGIFADIWCLSRTPDDLLTNGTFDIDLSAWALVDITGVTGTVTPAFDAADGLPAGSANLAADTNLAAVNNHRFYQIVPVTVGRNYKFTGKWKGSLWDGKATTKRNWTEVYLGFSPDTISSTWGSIIYKKRFVAIGDGLNVNFDTTSNGTYDWEDMSASPNTSPVPPTTAVWMATDSYMVISFNICGNLNGGAIWMSLDNLNVVECSEADLNADCEVDMQDAAQIAEDWLTCSRNPSDECWQ